ncbi:hypothetical protein LCGC14_2599550, partial [marine sediment metagenome]
MNRKIPKIVLVVSFIFLLSLVQAYTFQDFGDEIESRLINFSRFSEGIKEGIESGEIPVNLTNKSNDSFKIKMDEKGNIDLLKIEYNYSEDTEPI